jgi:hypothetical protein
MIIFKFVLQVLVGKLEGKRPLGRQRRKRWKLLKSILKIEQDGMGWIDLDRERDWWRILVKMVIKLQVKLHAGKFLSSSITGGLSRGV